MKVESIAECHAFDLHYAIIGIETNFGGVFEWPDFYCNLLYHRTSSTILDQQWKTAYICGRPMSEHMVLIA